MSVGCKGMMDSDWRTILKMSGVRPSSHWIPTMHYHWNYLLGKL